MSRGTLAIASAVFLTFAACGDGGSNAAGAGAGGSGGSGGGGGQAAGGTGGEAPSRDTSGYEGTLTWSHQIRNGVSVWDLAESSMVFEHRAPDLNELPGNPSLSADGAFLAYTIQTPYVLTTFFSTTHLVDLGSGQSLPYTSQGLGAGRIRNTTNPSLSGDGRRVAVAESSSEELGDGTYGDGTPLAIEVWDVAADERIRVTNGDSNDWKPLLDESGTWVVFLSDRDEERGDFYRAPVETDGAVTRLSFAGHPAIRDLREIDHPGRMSLSADGKWLAFAARVEGGWGGFLLDTHTGEIGRVDAEGVDVYSIAIAADGSRLAWSATEISEEAGVRTELRTALRGEIDTPTVARDSIDLGAPLAVSHDGSQLAFVDGLHDLWVVRSDGSDPKQVAGQEEGVSALLGMHLSF